MSVTFLIVDLWPMHPLNPMHLLIVLNLDSMCQCWLHAVLWLHIGIIMHFLAAEPLSTAGLLFPFQCPSGTILLTPYAMVWDWRVSTFKSRANAFLLAFAALSLLQSSTMFHFLFFLSRGWYCGTGVFGLIGYISLSLSFALLTSFYNNNLPRLSASTKEG